MRVAFVGIHIESSVFTPYRSSFRDFRIKQDKELIASYPWFVSPENYPLLPERQNDYVGLFYARALPGGIVDRKFFDFWWREFFDRLNKEQDKAPIDLLVLDVHGAMTVEGIKDAEGKIAAKVREVLGEGATVSCAMDLHGNVSDQLFYFCDLLTAYRTAPHIDEEEARFRALYNGMLHQKNKKDGIEWFKAKASVPILLSGEKTSTIVEPGKSLYESIGKVVGDKVMDAAIWMGFPWGDEPRNHGTVISVGKDEKAVYETTKKLAEQFLSQGNNFEFVGETDTVSGAIKQAYKTSNKPFFISDTGDNPGAGGVGDSTDLLAPLYENAIKGDKKVLFASIFDKETVNKCKQIGEGKKFDGEIGGKLDNFSTPVKIEGKIARVFSDPIGGEGVVIEGQNISIIVTEKRNQYTKIEQFMRAGVLVDSFDVIAVKIGYLEPELQDKAKGWVMALSTGAVNQDLNKLEYKHLKHPIIPFDYVNVNSQIDPVIVSTKR